MAKALLLTALHKTLADYVIGLSPEKLKVGVWSGKIVLHDLQVNPEAVNQLRLPVNILHGTVKKLEVHIPWAHLGSKPVKVFLEGVCVLVGPVDKNAWGDEEVQARRLGIKRASLQKADSADAQKKSDKSDDDDHKKKGYLEKLVQRIVDNIEIKVSDIHIRYEDTLLVDGQVVSAGLALESFVVTTTDANFEPQFVDRTKSNTEKVHKLAKVTGFSVYWRVDDYERFGSVPTEELSSALRGFVKKQSEKVHDGNGGGLRRGDIIRPTGALLKFVHNDDPNDVEGPMFEATLDVDDVVLDVRAEQYEQVLALKDSMAALSNWQTFFPYRPKTDPKSDPRAWWRYAYVCVTRRPDSWSKVGKVLRSREEYVSLFKKVAQKMDSSTTSSEAVTEALDDKEQKRFDDLEADLPLASLLMFRNMSRRELKKEKEERRLASQGEEEDEKPKKGWWGRLFGSGGSGDDEDEDVGLEQLSGELSGNNDEEKPGNYLTGRVTVVPKGRLRLYGRRDLVLAEARLAACVMAELRQDKSMSVTFTLSNFDVSDLYTEGAVFTHMIRVRPDSMYDGSTGSSIAVAAGVEGAEAAGSDGPLVSVNASMSDKAIEVDIRALPTDIVYNREVVDAIMSVFSTRQTETEAARASAYKSLESAQAKAKDLVTLELSVSVDVAAPKLIVPKSSSKDLGYLLLDMGHVMVKGGTVESGGMAYEMELKEMNVRLPARKALLTKGTGDALVKPFGVKADATVGGQKPLPGMAFIIEVMPGVGGVISPDKINGLFEVLDYVTKADLNEEDGPGEPLTGLAAPPDSGGVELMSDNAPMGSLPDDSDDEESDKEEEKAVDDDAIVMQVNFKLPSVSLLLVESEQAAADKDSGINFELAGMSMDMKQRPVDVTVNLHLDSITLEDRARPDDSPYRYIISSIPDESSHGGLIHVAFWMAPKGARKPPSDVADTDKEYDMAMDARFSTLEIAMDKDCIVTATPFYRTLTRQEQEETQEREGGGDKHASWRRSRGRSRSLSGADETRSVASTATQMVDRARSFANKGDSASQAKAVLMSASLTSVSLALVKSDPWETTMKATVHGFSAKANTEGGEEGNMGAEVALTDIVVTDSRIKAEKHAYRMILAPLTPSSEVAKLAAGENEDTLAEGNAELAPSAGADEDRADKDEKEQAPLISVKASKEGTNMEAQVDLASFACNLMVEPLKESLVVVNGIQAAVTDMLGTPADDEDEEERGQGEGKRSSLAAGRDDTMSRLERLDEEDEEEDESDAQTSSTMMAPGVETARPMPSGLLRARDDQGTGISREAQQAKKKEEAEEEMAKEKPSSINARLSLDDWRINLIDNPATQRSKVMVLRASLMALYTRTVTPGEGGASTEDTMHLSLVKAESLTDSPKKGSAEGERRISQMMEPFSAEVHAALLSARGSIISASLHMMGEDMDARLSYRDMMLVQGIVEQAMAPLPGSDTDDKDEDENENENEKGDEEEPSESGGMSILPETVDDAHPPVPAATNDKAEEAAAARVGVQPKAVAAISFSASMSLARVVLINDYEGQGVPVLDLASSQLKAEGNGFLEDFKVEVSGRMEASFFNVRVVRWEPLCEPWTAVLAGALGQDFKGRRTISVRLSCEQVVIFNLTSDFMESFLSTYWMLFSDSGNTDDMTDFLPPTESGGDMGKGAEQGESTGVADEALAGSKEDADKIEWVEGAKPLEDLQEGSVVLNNRSGLGLIVSTSDNPEAAFKAGPHASVPLPFQTERHRARAGQFDLRGKTANVKWGEEDMKGTRESLPPLQVDRTGTYVFPLLPLEPLPPGYVVSAPVVVEAFQNQRFENFTRKWRAPFLPGDGPEFSSKDWSRGANQQMQEVPLDSIELPDNNKWEWVDEWHIDLSKEVGKQIDKAGWEYAVEFSGFGLVNKSRTRREMDQARRRKWIRTRAPKPLPLDDPFRPLSLAWEISATPQGRLEATIRSTIQIKNETDVSLELCALCSAWPKTSSQKSSESPASSSEGKGSLPLGIVAPNCVLNVPVKLACASHIQMRPFSGSHDTGIPREGGVLGGEEDLFSWSKLVPLMANNVDTSRDDWVSCDVLAGGGKAGAEAVRMVAHAEVSQEGCTVVTIVPPITVVNALPCPFRFRVQLQAGRGGVATTLEHGRVPTADSAYLHAVRMGDGAVLSIKTAHHKWSHAEALLPSEKEDMHGGQWSKRKVTFKVPTGDGRAMEIQGHFEPRLNPSCPAFKVNVFCSHWLVDRTGLGLGFGITKKERLPTPRMEEGEEDDEDEDGEEEERQVHLSPVTDLSCASNSGTMLATASVGMPLYTDREYTFKKDTLPARLFGATYIRTACNDKKSGSQQFIRFRVGESSTVHVLYDSRCPNPPRWLAKGFKATKTKIHVSHRTSKGKTAECPFIVWSRTVAAGSHVTLGGNKAEKADTMYLVVVTEEEVVVPNEAGPSRRKIGSRDELDDSWAIGTEGMSLCHSPEEQIRVAIPQDDESGYIRDAWSDQLDVPAGSQGVFQVSGGKGETYELALRVESCPGTFRRSTQVTIVPRYCVVNLVRDESVWLKQPGTDDSTAVEVTSGGRLAWHWFQEKKGKGVHVRTPDTAWSYGQIQIDKVGTTALHIPFFSEDENLDDQNRGQAGGPPMKMPESGEEGDTASWSGGHARLDKRDGQQEVLHVDVKLADDPYSDEYAVLVVFWKASDRFSSIYSAANSSGVPVRLHQAASGEERKLLNEKAAWRLESGQRQQIGWAYPSYSRTLMVTAGDGSRAVKLKTETIGNYVKIPTGYAKGDEKKRPSHVWATVTVEGGTKVIYVSSRAPKGSGGILSESGGEESRKSQDGQEQADKATDKNKEEAGGDEANLEQNVAEELKKESQAPALEVAFHMKGFGLSLIGPVDNRRQEMLYAQVSDIKAKLSRDRLSSIEASIGSMQVDNHLPGGLYPVLVSAREERDSPEDAQNDKTGGKAGAIVTPFLQVTIIKEVNQATNTAHFNYVAFRMLELDVMADRASALHMLIYYKPIQGYLLMWKQQLDSRAWVAKRTAEIVERGAMDVPGGYVDVEEVRRSARIQRKYFKTLRFHPIILRMSYAKTPASSDLMDEAGLRIINKIPSMIKSHIDLASYLVEDAFGSIKDISNNITSHYTMAGTMQILNLVGSMRALGSPADLISNVGGGAKALVYAPAAGLVQGPAEFFEGVGKGAQSFVKGTVHGVFNSVAGVGGAVNDTVSKLTFDDEYQLRREQDRNRAMARQGGIGSGFKQGGKDFTGGITSGVSGIFTTPVKGARKGGVGGFFTGVGKGLVGAVVKPVVGASDAAVSLAQGISNEADYAQRQEHMRPRRALCRDPETKQLILEQFDMDSAEAQTLIEKGADGREEGTGDKYEAHTKIADLTIIFADNRVVLIKSKEDDILKAAKAKRKSGDKSTTMLSKKWEEVARVDVVDQDIMIRRYEGGDITLRAKSAANRDELYRQFYSHRLKMGDPSAMKRPEELFDSQDSSEKAPKPTMKAHSSAIQQSLDDYRFGTANRVEVPYRKFSEAQTLDRAEKQLQSVGVGNWSSLDEIAWELVQNWNNDHCGLSASRCMAVVFINASRSNIQFHQIRRRDGLGFRFLMGPMGDKDTHQLAPGGVAILFGWGHAQTNILKKGYIVVTAETTAFSGVFAVQKEKISMTSKGGFQAGFLEKTTTEWWSKQVVVIK